jgi:hypothetical protein
VAHPFKSSKSMAKIVAVAIDDAALLPLVRPAIFENLNTLRVVTPAN